MLKVVEGVSDIDVEVVDAVLFSSSFMAVALISQPLVLQPPIFEMVKAVLLRPKTSK